MIRFACLKDENYIKPLQQLSRILSQSQNTDKGVIKTGTL